VTPAVTPAPTSHPSPHTTNAAELVAATFAAEAFAATATANEATAAAAAAPVGTASLTAAALSATATAAAAGAVASDTASNKIASWVISTINPNLAVFLLQAIQNADLAKCLYNNDANDDGFKMLLGLEAHARSKVNGQRTEGKHHFPPS